VLPVGELFNPLRFSGGLLASLILGWGVGLEFGPEIWLALILGSLGRLEAGVGEVDGGVEPLGLIIWLLALNSPLGCFRNVSLFTALFLGGSLGLRGAGVSALGLLTILAFTSATLGCFLNVTLLPRGVIGGVGLVLAFVIW
jgi:hypothetical protein